jgi:hypothetical protein
MIQTEFICPFLASDAPYADEQNQNRALGKIVLQ